MLTFSKVLKANHNGVTMRSLYTEFEGYKVVFSESIPLAAAVRTYFDLSAPMVMVSAYFMELPENIQKFILYHEIAHIINGDVAEVEADVTRDNIPTQDNVNNAFSKHYEERMNCEGVDPREVMADLYALSRTDITTALEALEEISKFIAEYYNYYILTIQDEAATKENKKRLSEALVEINIRAEQIKLSETSVG